MTDLTAARRSAAVRRVAARQRAAVAEHSLVGPRLRLVREALGISEKEAAAIFRRTVRTYRRIEAGHALPGAFEFVTFIEQYRVPFGWLVYGDVPQDCAGLAPAAAIRKMTGMVTH